MTHSQRLRQMANRTGLDGFADELRAMADEIDAQAPVSDAQIITEAARHLGEMVVGNCGLGDIKAFARAILALRPAAQAGESDAHATARAFAIAGTAAEEFVRCNGLSTGEADEFLMTGPDVTDEYATACIDHLEWVGECVAFDCDDGVLVRLGDFTRGSLS